MRFFTRFPNGAGCCYFLTVAISQPLPSLANNDGAKSHSSSSSGASSSKENNNIFLRDVASDGSNDSSISSGNIQPTPRVDFSVLARTTTTKNLFASDGTCSNYGTTGYHLGNYQETLPASSSPNGVEWTWEKCAAECCSRPFEGCEYWTLQLNDATGACLLMTNKGGYFDTGGHIEGDRDEGCCDRSSPSNDDGAWRFVWSDEFDGLEGSDATALDSNTWEYETGYVRNNEAQYYSTRIENSYISNGIAIIEARHDNWNGHTYTSASRTTLGKKSFLYGRFSLRAKIDTRPGSWPAWWWLPDTGGWPVGGEIDMMEYYQNKVLFNVMDGLQRWSSVHPMLDEGEFGGRVEFANHFHTWTFDWSPNKIQLHLDGMLINDYDVSNADGTGPNGENPFRRPGYFLMNQAVGGSAGGDPSNTDFPVRYHIDWIRQWAWDESIVDGVSVMVDNGAGSGVYKGGTKATVAAGQPPVGQVFDSWSVVAGGVILDNPSEDTTTFTVPNDGGGSEVVIVEAKFGNPPTLSPVPGPTSSPVEPHDGVCSKYETTGWHNGNYLLVSQPFEAPNGEWWSWQECAKECATYAPCEFWTLQLAGEGKCHLMSNQGGYVDTHNHAEGDNDPDCASPPPSPTPAPSPHPTTFPTHASTNEPSCDPITSPMVSNPTLSPSKSSSQSPSTSPTLAPSALLGNCSDGTGLCSESNLSRCTCASTRRAQTMREESKQSELLRNNNNRKNMRKLKKTPRPPTPNPSASPVSQTNLPTLSPMKQLTSNPTKTPIPFECTCVLPTPEPTASPTKVVSRESTTKPTPGDCQ